MPERAGPWPMTIGRSSRGFPLDMATRDGSNGGAEANRTEPNRIVEHPMRRNHSSVIPDDGHSIPIMGDGPVRL